MLPTDAKARKDIPIFSGFIKYFPLAIAAVAELSRKGNKQHNPGKPLAWDRSKSGDELDALARHLTDEAAGTPIDTDEVLHLTKVAWRSMAALQKKLEVPALNPGWMTWQGTSRRPPVPGCTKVGVWFRDGGKHDNCFAEDWYWQHVGGSGDIVAYRVVD